MTRPFKIATLTLIGFTTVHLLLTTIYSLDFLRIPSFLRVAAYHYSIPFFYQSWTMFAPSIPEYHQELEYRYFSKNTWSSWADATASHEMEVHSAMEYVEQNLCSGLSQQVAGNYTSINGVISWASITESLEYHKAFHYAQKMHDAYRQIPCDSMQIRLHYTFIPPQGAQRERNQEYLEFPVIAILR